MPDHIGLLPIFHHRSTYVQKAKYKLNAIKNPCDMHEHNDLSNVAILIPCVNIHRSGHYQLEIIFAHAHLPPIAMDNTLHVSDWV